MKNQLKDTGHLRNCTAFEQLVVICSSIDARYRPSNPAIALAAISELSIKAPQAVNNVMAARNNYYTAVDLRTQLFSDLRPKASRIVSYFRSCGASEASIANLVAYNNQLQGGSKKTPAQPQPAAADAATPPRQRSNSQRSYDSLAQHFLSMVDILVKEPAYQPLEDELTVPQLSAFHQQLLQSSLAVLEAERLLGDARSRRNELLYADTNGLVSRSRAIKEYIKAAFGSSSHEYEQARAIVIKAIRI